MAFNMFNTSNLMSSFILYSIMHLLHLYQIYYSCSPLQNLNTNVSAGDCHSRHLFERYDFCLTFPGQTKWQVNLLRPNFSLV